MESFMLSPSSNYRFGLVIVGEVYDTKLGRLNAERCDIPSYLAPLYKEENGENNNLPVPHVAGLEKEISFFNNGKDRIMDFSLVSGLTLRELASYEEFGFSDSENKRDVLLFMMYDSFMFNCYTSGRFHMVSRYICAVDTKKCPDQTIDEVITYHLKKQYDSLNSANQRRVDYFLSKYIQQPKGIEKVKERGESNE